MTPPPLWVVDESESQLRHEQHEQKLLVVRALPTRAFRAVVRRGAFLRRTMSQSPLVKPWNDARYETRLARHAKHLPPLSQEHRDILAEMRETGVAVRTLDLPPDVLASSDRFIGALRHVYTQQACVKVSPRALATDPALFTWGLSPQILDLAEGYIGLPVRYLGVEVKRELLNAAARRSAHEVVRRWHLDHEDRRMFKIIVYLSDVDHGTGPFEYLDRSMTTTVHGTLHRRHHHAVSDKTMESVIPRDEWRQVTGPRLTAIYVDTGQVFHHACPPLASERLSVTFAYSSRHPYYTYARLMLPRPAVKGLRAKLSPRQWDALRGRRFG